MLRITRLGADGDGMATLADGETACIPLTLPGELVRATLEGKRAGLHRGQLIDIVEPASTRATPPCPHFGACGGCTLQHADAALYAEYKRDRLEDALRRAGYDTVPEPLHLAAPAQRRRLDLAASRAHGGAITLGLHERGGKDVVALQTCLVAQPALVALFAPLREALGRLTGLRRAADLLLNLLDTGPDLLLRTDAALTTQDRAALAALARAHGFCRISWTPIAGSKLPGTGGEPETVAQLRPAELHFGDAVVQPPPGAFLQASPEGEAAIRDAILAGLPEKLPPRARIVELYAGCGTFSFALATRGRVLAIEGAPAAAAALRHAAGGRRIEVLTRDLVRQPLQARELAGVACLVLDPPHAGAAAQMPLLAAGGVKRVIYVSCNPAALTRDLDALRQSGYRVLRATPIDQFLWSANLEAVVVLERG